MICIHPALAGNVAMLQSMSTTHKLIPVQGQCYARFINQDGSLPVSKTTKRKVIYIRGFDGGGNAA
jgi:hypothetical protein